MGVYDRQIQTASRLIAAKGEAVVWSKQTDQNGPDNDKPWVSGAVQGNPFMVRMLFLRGGNSLSDVLFAYMRGTDVPVGRQKAIMAGNVPFTPALGDTVTRTDGTVLSTESIDPLAPNGQVILYFLVFNA